jgi:threonine dehydrogenase-like Zn-dependent dehydrogenase
MKFENPSIVWQSNGIAALEERPEPPAEGEVSLRVLACGLCECTDSHIVKGEFVGAKSGVVLGNEACGEVVDVGPGVSILAGRSTCGCGS